MTENIQDKVQIKTDDYNKNSVKGNILSKIKKDKKIFFSVGLLTLAVVFAAFIYLFISSKVIQIDKSQILASTVDISTINGGVLNEVYVRDGDIVPANTVLARVGSELIKTKENSQIINVRNNIGKIFGKSEPIVTVINPADLRVVGTIDEDKGFRDIRVGQVVTFTVDTFGSKVYEGIVDEVSDTNHTGDVVFNISDKREIQKFDIKVRYSISKYPELKNGMSAKITIYK